METKESPSGPTARSRRARWLRGFEALFTTVPVRVFLLTLLVLGFTIMAVFNAFYREQALHRVTEPWVQTAATYAQRSIDLWFSEGSHQDFFDIGNQLPNEVSQILRIDITSLDHEVRFSTSSMAVEAIAPMLERSQVEAGLRSGTSVEIAEHPDQHVVIRPMPLRSFCTSCHEQPVGTQIGWMYVLVNSGDESKYMRESAVGSLQIIALVVLGLALVLGGYVLFAFLRPARRLAAHMRTLGDGPAPEPFDEASLPVDLRPIADGYNRGVRRLLHTRKLVERLERERLYSGPQIPDSGLSCA